MKKRFSFHTMVSFAFLAGISLCLLLLNVACGVLLNPVLVRDTKEQMKTYGVELEALYNSKTDDEADDRIDALLSEIYDDYLIRVSIVSADGTVEHTTDVFSRRRSIDLMEEMVNQFEEQSENPYYAQNLDDGDSAMVVFFIQKLQTGGYILMNRSLRGIEQIVQIVSWFLVLACILAAAVGMTVWTVATRPFSHSMEQMSSVTERIAHLDFSRRVNYRGQIQEVVVLSESIDNLSEQLEKSLNEMRQELERRKELLRNLAHEIKTPLTTIRGYTENMEIVAAGNQRAERYCRIILEECSALDVLATEMMEVSTLEGSEDFYEKRPLEAEELFQSCLQRIQRELPDKGIQVRAEPAVLFGNLHLLERVVLNYLGNADRYRIPGTPILLEGKRMGERYRIAVTNDGPELPEEERSRIWDAFYKGDKSRKRSGSYGVGLSLVRQIAEMHGAEADVISGNGKNTFFFELVISDRNPSDISLE